MTQVEGERLARIEEQVIGVREDISRMENTLASAAKVMAEMHINYVPRAEIERMEQARDKELQEIGKQLVVLWSKHDRHEKEIDKLKLWRSWLTGGLGVFMCIGILLFQYGKQWLGGK